MKIAFVTKKLESGGTEVSLINMLKKLANIEFYDITLFVFEKKGIYVKDIPKSIKIIEIFDKKDVKCLDRFNIQESKLFEKINIISMKILKRINYNLFTKLILKKTKKTNEFFDLVVDFHGYGYVGTNYTIDYINAKRKSIFIHDEKIDWISRVENIFCKFDDYLCVSNSCKKILEEKYTYTIGRTAVCRNIIDEQKVIESGNIKCQEIFDKTKINFLTIGRLEYQKGYDLLLNIADELNKKNINFKWYIIGGGTLKEEIQQEIGIKKLEDRVVMCGIQKNPYNYLKQCDFYIQTSRHEGYGIAIAEARIMKKIVISTNIECVREQIKDNENGILCDFNTDNFVNNIIHVLEDEKYRIKLQYNIDNQKFQENNDMEKFLDKVGKEINEENRNSNNNTRE